MKPVSVALSSPLRAARAVVSLMCAASVLVGCSSASAPDVPASIDAGTGTSTGLPDSGTSAPAHAVALTILPGSVFSGFDGTHTYQVPVSVYGAKGVKLVASDASKAIVEQAKVVVTDATTTTDNGESFMVTVKSAGELTLNATGEGKTASVTFTITSYAAARYAAGEKRYNTDAASGPACASCHAGDGAIDHSPTALAAASDVEVQAVITSGILREGNPIRNVVHKWAVTDTELDGLVTFLRALPPRGYAVGR